MIYALSPRRFRFAHRSFQACYLRGQDSFPHNIVDLLDGHLTLWRNVLELLPGEVDRNGLWGLVQVLLPDKDAPNTGRCWRSSLDCEIVAKVWPGETVELLLHAPE